jgi:hypothetical protein
MSLLDVFRKNPVDKIQIRELMEEEIRLKNQIDRIRKDITKLEKTKKEKFQEGIGADNIKKKMLAQELKQIDMQAQLKMKNFGALHKQYMFISNLVAIKKYERDLKKTPIWNKLTTIHPEHFENALIKVNLSGKAFENVLDDLNRIIGLDVEGGELLADEDREIFDTWASVESGSMDAEDAVKEFSIEKSLENLD